jgi:uncharacterized membrane protein
MIGSRLSFVFQSLREKLWIKPLGYALLAVSTVLLADLADDLPLEKIVPDISPDTLEKLLTVISASMFGVATFAVASMVSAYASAGSNASPRAFSLLIADGQSQTALSSFVGSFIFSIVGIIALKIGYFGLAGRFTLFVATLIVFTWVILTFVRWVDNIARLGRMANTVEKVERATREAFSNWPARAPLGGVPTLPQRDATLEICADRIGFVQHIAMEDLEAWARQHDAVVEVCAHPGALVGPARPLARLFCSPAMVPSDISQARKAFLVADKRTFATDPRFGLITLSEIALRALSPGINDPGTAIDVAVRMARTIREWDVPEEEDGPVEPRFERVVVSGLDPADIVEDGFAAISRDGVSSVEFGIWLQKSLALLMVDTSPGIRDAARKQARLALERAELELDFPHDIERIARAHRDALARE